MLARIVENWLTSTSERGYQTAFTQLLMSEGRRVLHSPVHHPFEHGKDLIAIAPIDELEAYQLKTGDIGLSELDRIQGQLFTLAGTAVDYPGVEPPRRPDRAFLVTNGRLTAPARSRLSAFNDANRQSGFPAIEVIETEHLVVRFLKVHGDYFPDEVRDLKRMFELMLADGRGPFAGKTFSDLASVILSSSTDKTTVEVSRALASLVLLTSYATTPWLRRNNHFALAEAWLCASGEIMALAERKDLDHGDWKPSFRLAMDSALAALNDGFLEATTAEDLIVPHLVDGIVYPSRAALVCGYCAAFFLSRREAGNSDHLGPALKALLDRELPYAQCAGEASIPSFFLTALALEALGDPARAGRLMFRLAKELNTCNQPDSKAGVADPYHSVEDVLLNMVGAETSIVDESFDGQSYMLHIILEWMARRGLRRAAGTLWPEITHIHLCEYRPNNPAGLLVREDDDGQLHSWAMPMPTSWAQVVKQAQVVSEATLPYRLWESLELLPFLPLIYPHRLTGSVAKGLDYMSTGRCDVAFESESSP